MNRFLTTILLSAIAVTLVSCDQPSGKTVKNNANSNQKKGQDELQVDKKFKYEFSVNGCSTGKQAFTSTDRLCLGLQDTALNNNCAQTLRESHFKANCSGTFTPTSTTTAVDDKDFETVKMELNTTKLDILLTSPEGATVESALTFISCFKDSVALVDTYHNGIRLLNNSKAVINRDLNYAFGDGSNASALLPHALLECAKDEFNSDGNVFEDKDYITKKLVVGDAVMVPVIMSPYKSELKTNLTYFSCMKDPEDAKYIGLNGVMLLPGAKVLVTKNINYYGTPSDKREKVIVTCE